MRRKLLTIIFALGVVATFVVTPSQAVVPGQNGRIFFASYRDGDADIYSMNQDGTGVVQLTNHTSSDTDPAVSPDGTKIAFRSHRSGCSDIYVMNADGSNVTRLTDSWALDTSPAWSPDGSKIAFTSGRDGNWEIYVMNANGSGETRLTSHPWPDYDPAWSPDGTKLAFQSYDGIMVANVNQAGPFVVNPYGGYVFKDDDLDDDSGQPTWSPNGSRIAFATSRHGLSEIYVVSADGNSGTRLTNTPTASEFNPVFSPDGTKIAYTRSNASGGHTDYEIYTMNAGNGSGQVRRTVAAGDDAFPDWGRLPQIIFNGNVPPLQP